MEPKIEHRVLLHLGSYEQDQYEGRQAKYDISQKGIAEKVKGSRSHISRILRKMMDEGLVKEKKMYVENTQSRKRKVYFLTSKGKKREKELRDTLQDHKFKIKTPDIKKKINGKMLDQYIDDQDPLLYALINVKNDVLDLTEKNKKEKSRFIDRKDELNFLMDRLDNCKKGNCMTVFLEGEAGTGKTTLAREFKQSLENHDLIFLEGKAYRDTYEPYLPFKKAFSGYMDDKSSMQWIFEREKISDERLIREKKSFDVERRSRFFEFSKELKSLAENKALVIFFDDFQWSDKASITLLNYLIDDVSEYPVFFLCAFRPEEIDQNHPLDEMLKGLKRRHQYEKIVLDTFKWEHTKELVASLLNSQELPSDFITPIYSLSGGNPLFIKEFIKLLDDEKKLPISLNDYPTDPKDLDIPEVIEEVIKRRLNFRLSEKARKICAIGCVIGIEVPFELLEQVSEVKERELLDIIHELLDQNIWKEIPEKDCFIFTHNIVNEVVYNDIPHFKRKRLHSLVAKKIEEFSGEGDVENYYYLGYQFEKAENTEKAVDYYYQAGKEAEKVYGHDNAIKIYEKALSLCDDELDEPSILYRLGEVNKIVGNFGRAVDIFDRLCNESDDEKIKIKSFAEMSKIHSRLGRYDDALDVVNEGLKLGVDESDLECKLLDAKGNVLFRKGDHEEAKKIFEKQREIAKKIDDKRILSQALHNLGNLNIKKGNYQRAKKNMKKAIDFWKEVEDYSGLWKSTVNLGSIYYYESELDKALNYYKKSFKIKKELGAKKGLDGILNNIALIYHSIGRIDKALEYHEKSLDMRKKIGDRSGIANSFNNIGSVYEDMGELDKALDYYEKGLVLRREIEDKTSLGTSLHNIGWIYHLKSDREKAERYYNKSLKMEKEINNKIGIIHTKNSLAELYMDKNKLDMALQAAQEALELSEKIGAKKEKGISHKILGKIYKEEREVEKAEKELQKAKDIISDIKDNVEYYKLLYELGIFKIKTDKKREAKDYLDSALDYFDSHDINLWKKRCQEASELLYD